MPLNIDYTDKDYEAFRNAMLSLAPLKLPNWTDLSEADFGVVLIELLAHGLDILSFYQDKEANEAFLPTAKRRTSVMKHCALVGYTLRPATPSRVMVTFYFSEPTQEITIPKGFKVGTKTVAGEDTVIFEVEKEVQVPDGLSEYTVSCVQGISVFGEVLGSGNSSSNQTFTVGRESVILDDSFVIWVNESGIWTKWTRVEDFINSRDYHHHYTAYMDDLDRVIVTFGDGFSGSLLPIGLNNIRCDYRMGGGITGNVGANTITQILGAGISTLVEVNNVEGPYIKAEEKESLDSARVRAPKYFRSQSGNLVTLKDFELWSDLFPGIECSQAVTDEYGNVTIYVKPIDGGTPSLDLKLALLNSIEPRRILTVGVQILDPTYDYIYLSVNLYINSSTYSIPTVVSNVKSVIENYFNGMRFQQPVTVADLFKIVMGIEGVANVVFLDPDTGNQFVTTQTEEGHIATIGNIVYEVVGGGV